MISQRFLPFDLLSYMPSKRGRNFPEQKAISLSWGLILPFGFDWISTSWVVKVNGCEYWTFIAAIVNYNRCGSVEVIPNRRITGLCESFQFTRAFANFLPLLRHLRSNLRTGSYITLTPKYKVNFAWSNCGGRHFKVIFSKI